MREFLAVVNAMADANRLRLLMSLRERELCVCNLVEFIGLADSTVSKHMSILRDAGLVEARKCGRWVYYRLAGEEASPLIRKALELAHQQLAQDRIVQADSRRIVELLTKDDGTMCQPDSAPCSKRSPEPARERA